VTGPEAKEVDLGLLLGAENVGSLAIKCLPGKTHWRGIPAIIDWRGSPDAPEGQSPVQLLEDVEYRFEANTELAGPLLLDPTEVFDADSPGALTGRLKPGRNTGTIFASLLAESGAVVAKADFEVRSRKLGYMDEYRWMLERITGEVAETVMHRFSASTQRFVPTAAGSPETIYQRFALIKAFLESDSFDNAISLILQRPHSEHFAETEPVHPGRGMKPGRALMKSLSSPGQRLSTGSRRIAGLTSLPASVDRVRHLETVDTVPNRFILHVLVYWRSTASSVRLALSGDGSPSAVRGVREAAAVEERLTAVIGSPLMKGVGVLEAFPAGNQVLQRREGYRDVLRAFLQGEVAATIDWDGGEDVFSAGLRDVATLYEFWVYFELARVLGEVLGEPLDLSDLFTVGHNRLDLQLKRGKRSRLRGGTRRRNRELSVSLFFNRQYKSDSWTEPVRPDCSIEFEVVGQSHGSTRLHFDAKYRVQYLKDILIDADTESASGGEDSPESAKSEDLLKMHAYRDAVRRTAGAYVLYPGSDENPEKNLAKYHEILPGIGAFVLRPTSDGRGAGPGVSALAEFLDNVVDHLASRGTSRERSGFWEDVSYAGWGARNEVRVDEMVDDHKPPSDIPVLLGFVKSEDHLNWIRRTELYNLRADDRHGSVHLRSPEVAPEIVVLYNPRWHEAEIRRTTGFVLPRTRVQLVESGYPEPRGDQYLCLELGGSIDLLGLSCSLASSMARVGRSRAEWAAPRIVTLLDIQVAASNPA
jgi:predicted component of viral defense system (DUF524 family)